MSDKHQISYRPTPAIRKINMDETPRRRFFRDRMAEFLTTFRFEKAFKFHDPRDRLGVLGPMDKSYMATNLEMVYGEDVGTPDPTKPWVADKYGDSIARALFLVTNLNAYGAAKGFAQFAIGKRGDDYHGAAVVYNAGGYTVLDPQHIYLQPHNKSEFRVRFVYYGKGVWYGIRNGKPGGIYGRFRE